MASPRQLSHREQFEEEVILFVIECYVPVEEDEGGEGGNSLGAGVGRS
jgi:hypothetical protein